jgi:hypothetical protein
MRLTLLCVPQVNTPAEFFHIFHTGRLTFHLRTVEMSGHRFRIANCPLLDIFLSKFRWWCGKYRYIDISISISTENGCHIQPQISSTTAYWSHFFIGRKDRRYYYSFLQQTDGYKLGNWTVVRDPRYILFIHVFISRGKIWIDLFQLLNFGG